MPKRAIKEQKRKEAVLDFNREIFKAIQIINVEEPKANITQINKYFKKNKIPKSNEYGLSLNTLYLKSLVEEGDLKIDVKTHNYTLYLLTKKST